MLKIDERDQSNQIIIIPIIVFIVIVFLDQNIVYVFKLSKIRTSHNKDV